MPAYGTLTGGLEINSSPIKDLFFDSFTTFPINDNKIVVAKIGKDFSWFSFVTLFITVYGLILYIYGMINIYNVFNDTTTFYGILILTAVTFAIGYWWFVNNTGEKRLREVYDN